MAVHGFQTSADGLVIEGISSEANTLRFETKLLGSSGVSYTESICNPAGPSGYPNSADYTTKMAIYSFTCPSFPVIFVCPTADSKPVRCLGVEHVGGTSYTLAVQVPNGNLGWTSGNLTGVYPDLYTTADALSNDYYVFSQTTTNGTEGYGMRMWDNNGDLSFDSSYEPLKFSGSTTFPSQGLPDVLGATYDVAMVKPAYLLRTSPAMFTYTNYNILYTNFVNVNLISFNEYVGLYLGQMVRSWHLTAYHATGFPGVSGNGAAANYSLCINILNSKGINVTTASPGSATSHWSNVTSAATFYPMIDGADYD